MTPRTIEFPGVVSESLARHLAVVEAIRCGGGRLVASFTLDEMGRTVGRGCSGGRHRKHRCGACGEEGHDVRMCMGRGIPPRARRFR